MFILTDQTVVEKEYYSFVQEIGSLVVNLHFFWVHRIMVSFSFLFFCLFLVNVPPVGYCTLELSSEFNDALVYAVKNHYWYQMYIGGCGIWLSFF